MNGTWTRPECKVCYRAVKRHYVRLRRNQITPELGTPCDCCGKTDEKLCWDHCHVTKKHRGWLCDNCNTGIGKLGDNLEGVQRAVDYLEESNNVEYDEKGDNSDMALS